MFRRYRLVRQNDRSDCGCAALATLALHHGCVLPLERLRELTGTGRNGASLLSLWRAAEHLQFSAKAVRCTADQLPDCPLPAIAHISDESGSGHYVVIFRLCRGRVLVGDPVGTVRWWSASEFQSRWTGNLLLAVRPTRLERHPLGKPVSAMQRFLRLLKPHAGLLIEVVACALLMTLLATLTSFFVQHLVDNVLVRMERPLLNGLGVGMGLVVLFRVLFSLLRQYFLMHVGRKVDLLLVGEFLEHLPRLPLRFFESRQSGEILARVTDAGKLREAVQGDATGAVVDVLVIAGVLATLWLYDAPLALLTTLLVPVFLMTVVLHHSAAVKRTTEAMEEGARLAAHLVEEVAGVETIKALSAEQRRASQGQQRLVQFTDALMRLQYLDLQVGQLSLLISGMASIGVLWYGAHRVMEGQLSIGQLMFFFTMLGTVLDPLSRLATVNLKLQDALTALDRLYQVLDQDAEPLTPDGVPFAGVHEAIRVRNLAFAYEPRTPIFKQLDLTIFAGERVAIVGESGSGKSTLLKLLLRLHLPNSGQILVDGTDLRDFQLESLRQRIGVVPQEPYIFNGSLRENLLLGAPHATMPEMVAAIRAAQLENWVNGLPQRFETHIGERGASLSGGQRQRLAIARAILARPEIVVFDEATSHLDTATENALQQSLETHLAGRTVIMVAHRLSTVRRADRILVMDQGQVIEEGSHDELLSRSGAYARLWRAQQGGLTSDGAEARAVPAYPSLAGLEPALA